MVNELFDAITRTMFTEFGETHKFYVEEIEQNATKPCFSVGTLNPIIKSRSLVRYNYTIPIVLHYFTDKDNTTDSRKDCYAVAERLWQLLEYLPYEDYLIRGEDMSWDIVEGVLQFFITYSFDVYKTEEQIFMEDGTYNGSKLPRD